MQPVDVLKWDQQAIETKKRLNDDFLKNARLPNMVSLFHYVLPTGHAALSISGNSYGFYPGGESSIEERLEMAIHKANLGEDLIWEARIATTPEKLQALEKKLDETPFYPCVDCSEAACRLLQQEINSKIKIPRLFSLSPALTRWRWSQVVDNHTVFPGVFHENSKNTWICPSTVQKICVAAECVLMAVAVDISSRVIASAVRSLLPNWWASIF